MLRKIKADAAKRIMRSCKRDYGESLSKQMIITLERIEKQSVGGAFQFIEYRNKLGSPILWVALQEDIEMGIVNIPFLFVLKNAVPFLKAKAFVGFVPEFLDYLEKYADCFIFIMAVPIVARAIRKMMCPPFVEKCILEGYFQNQESRTDSHLFVKTPT